MKINIIDTTDYVELTDKLYGFMSLDEFNDEDKKDIEVIAKAFKIDMMIYSTFDNDTDGTSYLVCAVLPASNENKNNTIIYDSTLLIHMTPKHIVKSMESGNVLSMYNESLNRTFDEAVANYETAIKKIIDNRTTEELNANVNVDELRDKARDLMQEHIDELWDGPLISLDGGMAVVKESLDCCAELDHDIKNNNLVYMCYVNFAPEQKVIFDAITGELIYSNYTKEN